MIRTVFVDNGTDESLVKALDRSKLHQEEIHYKTKSGKMATRKQWVSNDDAKNPSSSAKQQVKSDDLQSNQPKITRQYFPKEDCGKSVTRILSQADVDKQLLIHYNKNKYKYKVPYHVFRASKQASDWIKDNYFVSNGTTQTEEVYKVNGEYTSERKKLHEKIIKDIVDSANEPPKGQKPVAILMGGGSASGKGTIRKKVVLPQLESEGIKVGISDSDDIKEKMPEYKPFQEQMVENAAYRVHEESSYIADKAVDALIKHNKNLMFDGTMKNYQKYINLIDKLHKAGYEVQIVGADVPLDIALQRSDKRAKDTGRKVPHSIIEGSHGGFSLTLPQLIDKADSSILYDNTSKTPSPLMIDGKVVNKEGYDRFIQKGETHKLNKKVKQLSRDYGVKESVLRNYLDNGASINELEEFLDTMGSEGLEE